MKLHSQVIKESEERAKTEVCSLYPHAVINNVKQIVSFDNVIYIVNFMNNEGGREENVVFRFPKKEPYARPLQHTTTRQAWVCKKWKSIGKLFLFFFFLFSSFITINKNK